MKQLNRISYCIVVAIGLYSFGEKVFDGRLRIAPKKDMISLTESHGDSGGGGGVVVLAEGLCDWYKWACLFCELHTWISVASKGSHGEPQRSRLVLEGNGGVDFSALLWAASSGLLSFGRL